MFNLDDIKLYAITDDKLIKNDEFEFVIEETLKAGCRFIQLREKNLSFDDYVLKALKVKKITDKYNAHLIINDDISVCKKVDASGVHLGNSDDNASNAREILGDKKIIGVSAKTVLLATKAYEDGANYIGCGALFKTFTKLDATTIEKSQLQEVCLNSKIPVVAIGGIDETNALTLKGLGVSGIALISAIFGKENVYEATKNMLKIATNL